MKKEFRDWEPNKVYTDEFGRPSGIFLVDKPKDKFSHDIVYDFRRKYHTKKVGHAGTLDPFASGLLVVLVGKATKFSDTILGGDKTYEAEILLGASSISGDIEEKIDVDLGGISKLPITTEDKFQKILSTFKGEYNQKVPIYSSVKVNGQKLREVARNYHSFKFSENNKSVIFLNEKGEERKSIDIPIKKIKISEIELLEFKTIHGADLGKYLRNYKTHDLVELSSFEFKVAKIKVTCSKGTYIRQLAIDIGQALETSALLLGLRRTQSGDFRL